MQNLVNHIVFSCFGMYIYACTSHGNYVKDSPLHILIVLSISCKNYYLLACKAATVAETGWWKNDSRRLILFVTHICYSSFM